MRSPDVDLVGLKGTSAADADVFESVRHTFRGTCSILTVFDGEKETSAAFCVLVVARVEGAVVAVVARF